MIEIKRGDVLQEDTEALVNTVNCVGIMGRGVALQFKKAFPQNFHAYKEACERKQVKPGKMFVFETNGLTNPRYIINFPTKRHWRSNSRLEDIESGLQSLVEVIRKRNIRSIAVPPLGSGLGGLQWEDVRPRIERSLGSVEGLRVVIYEPDGSPSSESMVKTKQRPRMTAGRAALLGLFHRYHAGLLQPAVTLLELHKLMYFMQSSGEPLRLRYVKGPYGPYAENLRHVLNELEGHYIQGYADGGDSPEKELLLLPGAENSAFRYLERTEATRVRFDRVVSLVEGFETPLGLELLSTVHWVASRDNAHTIQEIVDRTYAWDDRKKRFTPYQIQLAWDVLVERGWLVRAEDGLER